MVGLTAQPRCTETRLSAECWLHPKCMSLMLVRWLPAETGSSASASRQQHQLRALTQAVRSIKLMALPLECHVLLGLGIIGLSPGSRDVATFPEVHGARGHLGKTKGSVRNDGDGNEC